MKLSIVCLAVFSVVLFMTALLSLGVGAVPISPGRILQILTERKGNTVASTELTIIWELRLPRLLLACFVGAGLGTAGAGYQGLFRNPLADPFVIGASSGAALGATLAIINGWQGTFLGLSCIPAASLAGALTAVFIVYSIAPVGRQIPMVSLLLAGVALSSMLAFARWRGERCFEDHKGQIGLDHWEGRRWLGLKRHLILSTVSYLFLAQATHRLAGEKSGPDSLPTAGGDQCGRAGATLAPSAARDLFERVARRLQYHQTRNARARASHTKTTTHRLRQLGFQLTELPHCENNSS